MYSHIKGKENIKNNNEGFDNYIILLIHVFAFAKIRQVKWKRPVEKYAWYDTADVSGAHSAISSVYESVTRHIGHEPSLLPLNELDCDWSTKC